MEDAEKLARLFEAARLYINFFQPSFKLKSRTRVGSKVTKRYYPPATPCDRLIARPDVSDDVKQTLLSLRKELDPIRLLKSIRASQADLEGLGSARADDVGEFLAGLKELWKQGEANPTKKKAASARRRWVTRANPFDGVWELVLSWLAEQPDLTAKAVLERLVEENRGDFNMGQCRTLQRRLRTWRAERARELIAPAAGRSAGVSASNANIRLLEAAEATSATKISTG